MDLRSPAVRFIFARSEASVAPRPTSKFHYPYFYSDPVVIAYVLSCAACRLFRIPLWRWNRCFIEPDLHCHTTEGVGSWRGALDTDSGLISMLGTNKLCK